jgi:hypothetical protein
MRLRLRLSRAQIAVCISRHAPPKFSVGVMGLKFVGGHSQPTELVYPGPIVIWQKGSWFQGARETLKGFTISNPFTRG